MQCRAGPVIADNLRMSARREQYVTCASDDVVPLNNYDHRVPPPVLEAFKPQTDFLSLLSLGDGTAIGSKWGVSFQGRSVHSP